MLDEFWNLTCLVSFALQGAHGRGRTREEEGEKEMEFRSLIAYGWMSKLWSIFWHLIFRVPKKGTTILTTTHIIWVPVVTKREMHCSSEQVQVCQSCDRSDSLLVELRIVLA